MIKSVYYIAKNANTLHVFQAQQLLLPTRFQINDVIASALSTKKFQPFISSSVTAGTTLTRKG